ncbi:MAG: peptide ABC transporter substrate-binding protein [Candidatus Melainabacteria bacterium]|nr:peptide ABC transporter substrate-binding protein [Candidatus Melainabacteria bacterium]
MITRREFNKLLLGTILFSSTSCTSLRKQNYIPNTLRLNLGYEPDTLDWLKATDSYSFDIIANIMVGLTKYTNDLRSIPSIAKKWDIDSSGKIYTFYLRDDAKWIDGRPVLADDFIYAWRRILNPETAGPYAYLLYPIKNAYKFNTGQIEDPDLLGIQKIKDNVLKVELERPTAFFLNLTSYCFYFPQRQDVIEKYRDDWTEPGKIITCGPFLLDKWTHEYKLSLKRNPLYNNPIPKLERVKYYIVPEQSSGFSLYLNNEIDLIDSRSIPISETETVRKMKETDIFSLLRVTYIGFNATKPPMNNKLVRRAFSHAINRDIFPKILRRGEIPTTSLLPPGLKEFYLTNVGCSFNPELARKLLAKAGYPDGKGFPKIKMLFPTREDAKLIAEAVQSLYKKVLNIKIELINEEWKVYLATMQQDPPHLFRTSWGADYPDPDTFMNLFNSDSGNNHGKWKNKNYDKIVASAASTLDLGIRKELYKDAQKLLLEDEAAIAPLFFNTQILLNKPWVKNFKHNPMDLLLCDEISVS